MTSPYLLVVGLETHVQLLTRTKLFCGCSTKFGLSPNSATCPVCIGLPGAMPVMNRRAFDLALKAALALDCKIAPFTKWDRKNYFYPDLPKNYQISQYDLPFSSGGGLHIQTKDDRRYVGLIRVHLEEDAGKMLHDEAGGGADSLVDLNRAGTPLLEIVSQPDIRVAEDAKTYLEEIRLLLRELDVSDCEMQEGSLRCDANVNLHILQPDGDYVATPLIEIKNLNSLKGVERAINFEAERQFEEFQSRRGKDWFVDETSSGTLSGRRIRNVVSHQNGEPTPVPKATAGWDDKRGRTEIQRRKEEASDYRYFPEPDLVPVIVDLVRLDKVRENIGELPAAQRERLQSQYDLSAYDAEVLSSQGRAFVAYFEQAAALCDDAKETSNWCSNEIMQVLNDRHLSIQDFPIPPVTLAELIREIKSTGLNKQRAREVFAETLSSGTTPKKAIEKLGFKVIADESQLLEMIKRAIAANPKAVGDYKKGKLKAADAIKGAVMRESKGLAKTELVQQLLLQELDRVETVN